LRIDHEDIRDFPDYTYDPLPPDKKRIRLMKLYSGEVWGTKIYCELVEVEYDKKFHIPTEIKEGEADNDAIRFLKGNDGKEEKQKEDFDKLVKEWENVDGRKIQYEALSWSWGEGEEVYAILIKKGNDTFKKPVRKALALALKYLRRPGKPRTLWIDAICINQNSPGERNHQVQMMSRIYTRARQVCIWLGEADEDSEIAIKFIKEEIMELKNFDRISSNERYSQKWQALMSLMQRDWFFRRWVVQEIALAGAATVYCGPHSIPWKSFAVAVELFVEVETATHRLSEVMKRDEKFRHVPNYFEYVSELGASLLVQATGKVFRVNRSPMRPESDSSARKKTEKRQILDRLRETQTIDPLERRSLLSLEFLISTMFIFQASEPRDVVYSLLAIARDAAPFAPAQLGQDDQKLYLVMTLLDRFLAEKPFTVDYSRPFSDICRDFVEFSIKQTHKANPQQALDILCRPWAPDPPKGMSIRLQNKDRIKKTDEKRLGPPRRKWKRRLDRRVEEYQGTNSDDFEDVNCRARFKYAPDPQVADGKAWEVDNRETAAYFAEVTKKENSGWPVWRKRGDAELEMYSDSSWKPSPGWEWIKFRYFPNPNTIPDVEPLPSWVARASQAPFMLDHAPGMEMRKTSRANAEPLVGAPQDGRRNYNAAGPEKLDLDRLIFKKRPVLGHYSLFVEGFELDEVTDVVDASQLGGIPKAWLELGGWVDFDQDPPDDFWRTIVADRGRDNRNPPYYYARACKESVHKGGTMGGSVNTMALINNEQSSIVAEFCRRVHAVIWNRSLFRTKDKRLGLAQNVKAGDKVFILKGCTVPVVLSKNKKSSPRLEVELEQEEDRIELLKALIRKAMFRRERKFKYKAVSKDAQDADTKAAAEQKLQKSMSRRDNAFQRLKNDVEEEMRNEDAAKEKAADVVDDTPLLPRTPPGSETKKGAGKHSEKEKDKGPQCWYQFKGECYLHGMMDGEAMRKKFNDQTEYQTLELR
ncbi:HET-domain-containing protein, partial [Lindgomyces ingoldianus]